MNSRFSQSEHSQLKTSRYQRRLVTIMSADVQGFCRLVAADEEGAVDRLKVCRELVESLAKKRDGRTFGIAGDSIMVEFSSPVEASRCAVEIQQHLDKANAEFSTEAQLQLRIGIHIGDVVFEDGLLYGDDVNIAARLQAAAPSGGILVSHAVRNHVGNKVKAQFIDIGNLRLKNITNPVQAYQMLPVEWTSSSGTPAGIELREPVPGFGGRSALAVMPFHNMSANPDCEYIADGLAEDLISGLSALRWLPVIARNSSFIFRGRAISANDIGRMLGARYLLQGSVRVAGDALRVTVELVDAQATCNLWSEQFDVKLGNIFEVQDAIVEQMISSLDYQIDVSEQRRSRAASAENLDVWGLIRRAMWHQHKLTREDAAKALDLFNQALERDPNSVDAHVQKAWWHFWDVWTQRGSNDGLIEMEKLARKAMLLDSMDARTHMMLGIALLMMREPVRGRAFLLEAIRLNPSLYLAHGSLGTTYVLEGEAQKATDPLLTAMRLNPHDLYLFHAMGELAMTNYMLGQWAEALLWCERSLSLRPGYWYPRAIRVAALARSSALDAAVMALEELKSHNPRFCTNHVDWVPFSDKKWNDNLLQGLMLAGYKP